MIRRRTATVGKIRALKMKAKSADLFISADFVFFTRFLTLAGNVIR